MMDKKKSIKLIILIAFLGILFIGYGISIKSTPESREKKIISYLEKKYNSEFEIIKISDNGENILINEVRCDRATLCPEIKDKGVYYYNYEVRSVSDNVTFEVKYLDRKLSDKITEITTYYSIVNKDNIIEDINNYIIRTLSNENITIQDNVIKIDKNFDEICDNSYIRKIEKISTYVEEKNDLDSDLHILVYLEYSNGVLVTINGKPTITKRSMVKFDGAEGIDVVTGKYMKFYNSIEEYLER